MLTVSPAVSPNVVANILMTQKPSVTAGTLVIVDLNESGTCKYFLRRFPGLLRRLGRRRPPAYKQALKTCEVSESPMPPANSKALRLTSDRRLLAPVLILALQAIAAVYFLVDGIDDMIVQARDGLSIGMAMECIVAIALLGGVVMGSRYVQRLIVELRRKETALANARGALAEHIAMRFDEWDLTPGEGEVALFALKGCDVAEIARLRGAASGTVRSQLSQIYAKAGVSSQAMLVSLFIEDLLPLR